MESDRLKLQEVRNEISDKFLSALNNIPDQILCKLPGYDAKVHQTLRILYQQVKAKTIQTERKLLTLDQTQSTNQSSISSNAISSFAKHTPEEDKCTDNVSAVKDSLNANTYENGGNDSKKRNSFQLKKPLMTSSACLTQSAKRTENVKDVNSTEKWANIISSQISSLPTSTITKQIDNNDCAKNNKAKKAVADADGIISISGKNPFSSSFAWHDSDGTKFNFHYQTHHVPA